MCSSPGTSDASRTDSTKIPCFPYGVRREDSLSCSLLGGNLGLTVIVTSSESSVTVRRQRLSYLPLLVALILHLPPTRLVQFLHHPLF